MALQARLRASAAGCAACRTSLFRHFISPFSPALQAPFRPSIPAPTVQLQPTSGVCRPRFYSEKDSDEAAPWYLDEEPRRHPTLTADALTPLPTAPEGSPRILSSLIPQLANDLGLEDLKLLDLRSLNPPAALGPGLIMLFGTARSERHLHISGRFLKSWLRNQGIRADADGLLGRREFKVKSRRQRRKAKLLGTSAVTYAGESSLTTSWICMNLGTIGSEPQEEAALESVDGSFTGFGVQQDDSGTTIIVQMLTESKRKELDLETLWSRILARRGDPGTIQDDLEYQEARTQNKEVSIFSEGGSSKVLARPSQRRFFSTSHRRFPPLDGSTEVIDPPNHTPATSAVDTFVDPAKYIDAKLAELGHLRTELASLSVGDAIKALEDSPDGTPSHFLRTWNCAIKFLPPDQSWKFRIWLVVHGRKLGSRRFTLSHLKDLHEELELNGILCSQEDYLEILQAIYLEPKEDHNPSQVPSDVALRVLRTMFERGRTILKADVIVPLIESLARNDQQNDRQREIQGNLEKLILQADLPYMGEELIMRLLAAYAYQCNWNRFWDVWRMPPKHLQARSAQLYLFLWNTISATGNQRLCRRAIRGCFYEMLNESTPIELTGPVKNAVRACARVAEPSAEEIAQYRLDKAIPERRSSTADFARLFYFLNHDRPPS